MISFTVGAAFLASSVILAVVFSYPHFYTSFAFGSWLVLDFIDWRRNGSSILGYFYSHRHRDAFFAFFLSASFFCLVIDYAYGVLISGMWQWVAYKPVHYVRMYVFMNASYVLGMYELYRVVRSFVQKRVSARHLFESADWLVLHRNTYRALVAFGALFVIVPLYALFLGTDAYVEFAMLLPFVGMFLIADGLNGILGGRPLLADLIKLNSIEVTTAAITVLSASVVTEMINLFGREWRYVRMPFPELQFFTVPAAVFVGWIPLVLGSIALVRLVRRADLVWDRVRKQ